MALQRCCRGEGAPGKQQQQQYHHSTSSGSIAKQNDGTRREVHTALTAHARTHAHELVVDLAELYEVLLLGGVNAHALLTHVAHTRRRRHGLLQR